MDSDRYNKRWMAETVFSSIKRTLGAAVRARSWHLEFREMILNAPSTIVAEPLDIRQVSRCLSVSDYQLCE